MGSCQELLNSVGLQKIELVYSNIKLRSLLGVGLYVLRPTKLGAGVLQVMSVNRYPGLNSFASSPMA